MKEPSKLAIAVERRFKVLEKDRKNWESHWDEVAKYVVPRKDNVYGNYTPGQKKNTHLFNSTAIKANDDLANALASLMINPASQWFDMTHWDDEVDIQDDVRKWLGKASSKLLNILNKTNFQIASQEMFVDYSSFGTGFVRIKKDKKKKFKFFCYPIYEVYLGENADLEISAVGRKIKMPIADVVELFGKDFLEGNPDLQQMYQKKPDKCLEVVHLVDERTKFEAYLGEKDGVKTQLPYVSIYMLSKTKEILEEKGFKNLPFASPRFSKSSGEIYGRGPAMKSLPDTKTVNSMDKVVLMGGQLAVAPPLQAVDNGLLRPVKFKPYGLTYRRPGSDPIQPLVTNARPDIGLDLITNKEEKIEKMFFSNELRIIEANRMTATEIMQRRDEQFRSLASVMARISLEYLRPVIDFCFAEMIEDPDWSDFMEEMPEALRQGGELKVEYSSLVTRALKTAEAEAFNRGIQLSSGILEAQPEVFDNIDGDKVIRHNMKAMGVNPEFLRSTDERDAIRQQRAEAQQAQMEQAQQMQQLEMAQKMGGQGDSNGGQGPV
jgi:hypothetical protein